MRAPVTYWEAVCNPAPEKAVGTRREWEWRAEPLTRLFGGVFRTHCQNLLACAQGARFYSPWEEANSGSGFNAKKDIISVWGTPVV
jgi:hypothetical protein